MHRKPLLELLDRYRQHHPQERRTVDRFTALVRARSDCFLRSCLPGHLTASTWISSHDGRQFLLTQHRKLGRWLQLGGHADGDPDLRSVALREAREESGMGEFEWVSDTEPKQIVDLDVHVIPARGAEPLHEHFDVRFVLRAAAAQALHRCDESTDLRWFPVERFDTCIREESLRRLGRKALAWLV